MVGKDQSLPLHLKWNGRALTYGILREFIVGLEEDEVIEIWFLSTLTHQPLPSTSPSEHMHYVHYLMKPLVQCGLCQFVLFSLLRSAWWYFVRQMNPSSGPPILTIQRNARIDINKQRSFACRRTQKKYTEYHTQSRTYKNKNKNDQKLLRDGCICGSKATREHWKMEIHWWVFWMQCRKLVSSFPCTQKAKHSDKTLTSEPKYKM